jgi:hypothetical protein
MGLTSEIDSSIRGQDHRRGEGIAGHVASVLQNLVARDPSPLGEGGAPAPGEGNPPHDS